MTTTAAHITADCKGPNRACKAAHREGRRVHVIPSLHPLYSLVMPTYHFATPEAAITAERLAHEAAPFVTGDDDLYSFRAQGIAHKIPRGFVDPTRR